MNMMGYALGGLALYTVVAHVVGYATIGALRRRVGRLEQVFRQMGVVFGEDDKPEEVADVAGAAD